MIQAVLFDLDGVLVNACDFHYHALNKALGFELTREEHEQKYNGLSTKKKLEMLVKEGRVSEEDVPKIWDLKQKYTQEYIYNLERDHIKIEMMQKLFENNIRMACVTNAIRSTAKEMLIRTGTIEYMDIIVSNEDVKLNKPYPDGYIYAINHLWLTPKDVMIVEDSDIGVKAAKQITDNVLRVPNADWVNKDTILYAIRTFNERGYPDGGAR